MKLKTVGALFGAAALAVSMTACSTANDTQTKDTGGGRCCGQTDGVRLY